MKSREDGAGFDEPAKFASVAERRIYKRGRYGARASMTRGEDQVGVAAKIILSLAAVALVATAIVPPWVHGYWRSTVRISKPLGWAPIFRPPASDYELVRVDVARLLLLWAAIVLVAGVALLWARRGGSRAGE